MQPIWDGTEWRERRRRRRRKDNEKKREEIFLFESLKTSRDEHPHCAYDADRVLELLHVDRHSSRSAAHHAPLSFTMTLFFFFLSSFSNHPNALLSSSSSSAGPPFTADDPPRPSFLPSTDSSRLMSYPSFPRAVQEQEQQRRARRMMNGLAYTPAAETSSDRTELREKQGACVKVTTHPGVGVGKNSRRDFKMLFRGIKI